MENENKPFLKDGLAFSCKRCSSCCCGVPGVVFMSQEELETLSELENLTTEQFIAVYCRWIPSNDGFDYLSFRETAGYKCIFWEEERGCRVYQARPVQCRTYPFWSHILQSEENWLKEGKKCPGIGEGSLHTSEEILSQEELYKNRILVRRPSR